MVSEEDVQVSQYRIYFRFSAREILQSKLNADEKIGIALCTSAREKYNSKDIGPRRDLRCYVKELSV